MAKDERILAIDIGATSIKLCEFEYGKGNAINLVEFAYREYEEEITEGSRASVVTATLNQIIAEHSFKARKALVSLSGQAALMRFSRLPEVTSDKKKIRQLAEFEATNNIPFPINEVIWDYQLITSEDEDTKDVLSVVIKDDVVEQYTNAIIDVGLDPILVDVAPAACYNAARANGLGDEECVIIVNIGGRSTNLLFAEGDRFYARNIPTAGHSITQMIAKEFGVDLAEAEALKRQYGFVALNGTYAEPESEKAAAVSKIIRTVMARLHGEISRSINVYRAQQRGSKPVKMYLTGGSSIMSYCDAFFQEKLEIPVEYLNPFTVINLAPSVDKEKLGAVAHMFSETIGLGLRYCSQCPIEFSLLPPAIRRQQALTKKKPYLVIAGLTLLLTLGMFWYNLAEITKDIEKKNVEMQAPHNKLAQAEKSVKTPDNEAMNTLAQYNELGNMLMQRARWSSVLNEIYRLKPDNLWINSIVPIYNEVDAYEKETIALPSEGSGNAEGYEPSPEDMFEGMGYGRSVNPLLNEETLPIAGLNIVGTCLQPYPAKPIAWSMESKDAVDFKDIFQLDEKPALVDENAPKDEEGDADKPELSPEQFNKQQFNLMKKKIVSSQSPELAFESALRMSPLFDSDASMTVKTRSRDSYTYPAEQTSSVTRKRYRLVTFKMQVKFATNFEFNNIPHSNMNAFGEKKTDWEE